MYQKSTHNFLYIVKLTGQQLIEEIAITINKYNLALIFYDNIVLYNLSNLCRLLTYDFSSVKL